MPSLSPLTINYFFDIILRYDTSCVSDIFSYECHRYRRRLLMTPARVFWLALDGMATLCRYMWAISYLDWCGSDKHLADGRWRGFHSVTWAHGARFFDTRRSSRTVWVYSQRRLSWGRVDWWWYSGVIAIVVLKRKWPLLSRVDGHRESDSENSTNSYVRKYWREVSWPDSSSVVITKSINHGKISPSKRWLNGKEVVNFFQPNFQDKLGWARSDDLGTYRSKLNNL